MSRPALALFLATCEIGLTEEDSSGVISARMVVLLLLLYILQIERPPLLAEAKFADDVTVSLDICLIEISQMPTTPSHQL